jgi:hypothetical protein
LVGIHKLPYFALVNLYRKTCNVSVWFLNSLYSAVQAFTSEGAPRLSTRTSVEVRHRNAVKLNVLQTSNIDSRHALALGVSAFAIGMHTALGAKAMLDHMLVEGVAAGVSLRCEQLETLARHKPQERAFALTDRTITRHGASQRALNFKFNLPAMTASKVFHALPPSDVGLGFSQTF